MRFARFALPCLLSVLPLAGGELPVEAQAKFIKILAISAGSPSRIACNDPAVMAQLAKMGFTQDPAAKVAWAANENDVRSLKAPGRLIICGKLELLMAGGSAAIVDESGKPSIYLSMLNLSNTGVTLSDAVLKIAKRL